MLLQTEQTQIRQLLLELPDQGPVDLHISVGTLVNLTSNFFVLCTNLKDYLYNYS